MSAITSPAQVGSKSVPPASRVRGKLLKPAVFLVCIAPFIVLLYSLLTGNLGPNPIEVITNETGEMGLRLIIVGLALTPLRWLLKQTWPVRLRRMIGLFAFFYVSLHFLTYLVLDQQLDLLAVWDDLLERPYIVAGFIGFCLLLPLAITSTRGWVKRLGRRWQSLHRLVYLAGAAGVVHFVWLAKGDLIEPYVYLGLLMVLLSYRLLRSVK